MREVQLSTNHCPRFGVSLLTVLGIVLAGSVSAQSANTTADMHQLENSSADSIRQEITKNWNLAPGLPGMKDVHVQIRLMLDRSGQIVGQPDVKTKGGPEKTQSSMAASALRAVLRAAPFKNLPQAQFDNATSSVEVIINFETGDMAL